MTPDPQTHDPVCGAGCGSWVSAESLDGLLSPTAIERGSRDNPFRVEAFGALHCPRCRTLLVDRYVGNVSFAHCTTHGIWIDGETRSELLAAYASVIEEDAVVEAEVAKLDELDPRELVRRIIKRERALAEHASRLDDLEQRLPR